MSMAIFKSYLTISKAIFNAHGVWKMDPNMRGRWPHPAPCLDRWQLLDLLTTSSPCSMSSALDCSWLWSSVSSAPSTRMVTKAVFIMAPNLRPDGVPFLTRCSAEFSEALHVPCFQMTLAHFSWAKPGACRNPFPLCPAMPACRVQTQVVLQAPLGTKRRQGL